MDTQSNGPNSIAATTTDYKIHSNDSDAEAAGAATSVDVETASASQHEDMNAPIAPQQSSPPVGTRHNHSVRNDSFDRTKSLCANGIMILLILGMIGAVVAFSVLFAIQFLDSTEIGPTGIIVFVFFLVFLVCLVPRVSVPNIERKSSLLSYKTIVISQHIGCLLHWQTSFTLIATVT